MDNTTTGGLFQLASNMGGDVLMAAKKLEALGLQKNKITLSQLYTFQILLEEVYGMSCPTPEDYANRRDLIRIFNEIAREMYGNNDQCPVVENFGSFSMDMFSAKSDLDLSINFRDQSFESDRVAKTKTLRKFAKKFYSLRKNGHVTTVELILSARVPVLKVTDSGSGIECDLSVGNRDGIAKSHIVRMISSIDERFQKLSFMMKAWAKAHDINSSKDGTLNSLSLILLAAFHLQTRDIPILPPFSAIFKGGMDPATVKLYLPGFLYYGKKNKESLAELFVSLLVKLESVETLWSRGLCASTYEGSWIYRNPNTTGYISIEDFTDRSQNTARAVKSKKMNKIYSCIRCSIEQIQSFTAGIIDATQLKCLLFGRVSPITKKVCANPSQKEKRLAQDRPGEGQRPEKQSKHVHNSFSVEAPTPSRSSGVEKMKVRTGRNTDPATSDTLTSFQELDKSQESQTPNPIQNKKDLTQGGSAKGQSPGNLYNYGHTCITEAPNPSKTNRVKKMKSRTGKKTDIATSDTPTSFQGSDKSQEILTPNPGQKEEKRPAQGGPAEGQRPGKQVKHGLVPCSTEASTPSRRSKFKKKKSKTGKNFDPVTSGIQTPFQGSDKSQEILTPNPGQKKKKRPTQGGPVEGQRPGKQVKHGLIHRSTEGLTPSRTSKFKKKKSKTGRKFDPVTSNAQTSILGLNKSQETLTGSCQPLPVLPVSSSVGYKSLGADIGALNNATHSSQKVQLSSTLPNQSSGEIRRQSFPVGERPYLSNAPSEQCRRYGRQKTHVDALSHATPRFSESHPPYIYTTRSSGGFTPNRTHVETWKHAAPNILLRETLPVSGYQGFNTEKNIFETLKVAGPNISLEQPYSHPNYQLSQGSGRFRSENYHVETPRYAPNVLAAPSVPVPNLRVQGGESLPRMHFEFPSYSATQQYSSSLANLASGFGPERTHAEIINQTPSLQTSLYTLASRPSNPMPFHQPYHLHHREPSGLQRYHDPHHSFHLAPSQFAPNMHPYQS